MAKAFFTYDQQINKLTQKGLIVNDVDFAKEMLQRISYYSLIGGYKEPFKHKPSGNYLNGVEIEEIIALYYFDENLRSLFLKYILHIERHIKSMLSYYFCEKYGENQSEYLNPNNYNLTSKTNFEINKMISIINKAVTLPSDYSYIIHNVNKYNNVPLWVAMNALTFGNVASMYQYCTSDIRSKISHNYANVTEVDLHRFIRIIAKCRNVCAHGERLFQFHSRVAGPNTLLHKKLSVPQNNGSYNSGKHDLFAVVIAMRYLLSNTEFKKFKSALKKEIEVVLIKCPHLSRADLYSYMGLTNNWNNITRYRK